MTEPIATPPVPARRWPRRVAVGMSIGAVVMQIGAVADAMPPGTTGLAACRYWAPPLLVGAAMGGLVTSALWRRHGRDARR